MSINPSPSPFAGSERLNAAIAQLESEVGCRIHLAARDLTTGDEIRYNADVRVKTASTIKFPMLMYVAEEVVAGAVQWDEMLTLTDADKVGGSGVLNQLTTGLQMSLRDICTLMTIVSDNTATNMVIERIGVVPMNARFDSWGLTGTRIFRKSYTEDTEESLPFGLGSTTPSDMCLLMTRLAEHRIADDKTCGELIAMMRAQQYRDCIPRYLSEDWVYAGKTGSVDGVRNDVGLVTTPDGRQFALALFTQEVQDLRWTSDNAGLIACARLAELLLTSR